MKKKIKIVSMAALACSMASLCAVAAEDAKPAADSAKEFVDGRWRLKDGTPTYKMGEAGAVDWASWQGFRRYHDACHVCHGPNANGSTFAPALADSLKTMDYSSFMQVVASGREAERGGTKYVMPAFGSNRDVMCYIDDIYTYIKARSDNAAPPGRPPGRADISDVAKKNAKECIGE